jgi:hypothetical protein
MATTKKADEKPEKSIILDEGHVTSLEQMPGDLREEDDMPQEETKAPLNHILGHLPAIAEGGGIHTVKEEMGKVFPKDPEEAHALVGKLTRAKMAMEQICSEASTLLFHRTNKK